ncbi:VOC family protein [Dermacoccaceae bacterium W4C1]
MSAVAPFLTFQPGRGQSAAAAMAFYVEVFDGAEVVSDHRFGADGPGREGTVMAAEFVVAGQRIKCSDSFVDHEWDFTPAVSLWVDLADDAELHRIFDRLAEGGTVFMPVDDYGFGLFGWVGDRFGVTWQLALASVA